MIGHSDGIEHASLTKIYHWINSPKTLYRRIILEITSLINNEITLAPCRFCGATQFRYCLDAPDFDSGSQQFTLWECQDCGLTRIEPLLDDEALGRYYRSDYYGAGQRKFVGPVERVTCWLGEQRARQLVRCWRSGIKTEYYPPRVLDIGCGRGALLRALAHLGCECHGVERVDFPEVTLDAGFYLYRQPLAELAFSPAHFDIVVLWHVLEHLSNPGAMITEVRRILRPGGLLALAVPNFASRQRHFFGPCWFHLDLPRHLHHFGLPMLDKGLEHRGFRIVSTDTWAFDQNVFGFIQSALNRLCPSRPNRLYQRLRQPEGLTPDWELGLWLTAAGLLAPLAGVEWVISGLLGQGATAIIYAYRL